jgi:hypothetical protein
MRAFRSLAVLLAAGPLWAAPLPLREDYQKKADAAPWQWSDGRASAADSARRLKGDYQAEVESRGMFGEVVIRIRKGGAAVHSFPGHVGTVFAVRADVLYSAQFSRSAPGCAVAAYDLREKKQLWTATLRGLGPIEHSAYRNAVLLDLDTQAVCVRGNECLGRYIEYVDLRTGKTVGHKRYSEEE